MAPPFCWESFIIRLDILKSFTGNAYLLLRIFHYSPWYTYGTSQHGGIQVENLSLFALIYLSSRTAQPPASWESFIIRLDILNRCQRPAGHTLRIFHYSPWYTYYHPTLYTSAVENLSLFALIYLTDDDDGCPGGWESFIIRLDILMSPLILLRITLRIFHYSPWYTYSTATTCRNRVENLSLFALIYLASTLDGTRIGWESFIIRLDILKGAVFVFEQGLRIFHYSPWYTYANPTSSPNRVENLSLFALIYLKRASTRAWLSWESFIIRLDILIHLDIEARIMLRIFHYSPWYT